MEEDSNSIIGKLISGLSQQGFVSHLHTQTRSWANSIEQFKACFRELKSVENEVSNWNLLLEYPIPRRAKRIDAVLITKNLIFIIEYKSGKNCFAKEDREQLVDYCLDLQDFHYESRNKYIIPLLYVPDANIVQNEIRKIDDIYERVLLCNAENIGTTILSFDRFSHTFGNGPIDAKTWNESKYEPTLSIIDAARVLYEKKEVIEISRSHAGFSNLTATTNAVIKAVEYAKTNNKKIICFITGVPGAGKTLAGLNIIHNSSFFSRGKSIGAFLSGNGPLVKILTEALAIDYKKREHVKMNSARREVKTFIYNVHNFIDDLFLSSQVPSDKIIVFDEAQRAWDAKQSMRKFKRNFSEPQIIFEIMNRHIDWAVIIALIGSGQEINSGEAGISEWGRTLLKNYSDWEVFISPVLKSGKGGLFDNELSESEINDIKIVEDEDLHLNVSIRALRSEHISNWVEAVLEGEVKRAGNLLIEKLKRFPLCLTRDINKAKEWLREHDANGNERYGILATSGARRLRAYGLDVEHDIKVEKWFLAPRNDVRSSYYLEIPATEFAIQGLEIDWAAVCWADDLRREKKEWGYYTFKGTRWNKVNSAQWKKYILNKYRVLLTRSREGMIIWVPEGDESDFTRKKSHYDETAEYLKSCGLIEL